METFLERQHGSGGIFNLAISYNPIERILIMFKTNAGIKPFFVKMKDFLVPGQNQFYYPMFIVIIPPTFFDVDLYSLAKAYSGLLTNATAENSIAGI